MTEVLVFGAKSCSGCVTVKRVLQQKGIEFKDLDVNSHENMEEAMANGVRSIPTLVIKDGSGVHTYVGEKNSLQGIAAHLEV